MTRHIKFIYLLIYLFACFGCNKKKSTQKEKNLNEGVWYCAKYDIENRVSRKFTIDYAEEIKKHSYFKIVKDTVFLKGCKYNYEKVSYDNIKKYSNEELVISFSKKNKPPYSFIKLIPSSKYCNNLEHSFLFIKNKDTLLLFSDGYYFSYTKDKRYKSNYNVEGFPCDYKNPLSISGTFGEVHIQTGFDKFKKEFPFGSENLLDKLPKNNFIDTINYISYNRKDSLYTINKEVSAGNIVITFTKSNGKINFTYRLDYPEY